MSNPAPTRRRLVAVLAGSALLLLAACSSGGSDAADSTTTGGTAVTTTTATAASTTSGGATTTVAPTTTAGPTTTTAVTKPAACAGKGPEVPAGAITKKVADVDGDGIQETGWVAMAPGTTGAVRFGIDASAGGGDFFDYESAAPTPRSMLVANVDDKGPTEIIFTDNRGAELHAFVNCKIQAVTNPQGRTYSFSLGFGDIGTGVGCVDTSEGRRLVGLDITDQGQTNVVHWSRTIIELDGLHAHNGAKTTGTFTRGVDDAKIQQLQGVSCGTLTLAHDAVTFGN